jgi:hypothetical protein
MLRPGIWVASSTAAWRDCLKCSLASCSAVSVLLVVAVLRPELMKAVQSPTEPNSTTRMVSVFSDSTG